MIKVIALLSGAPTSAPEKCSVTVFKTVNRMKTAVKKIKQPAMYLLFGTIFVIISEKRRVPAVGAINPTTSPPKLSPLRRL